MCKLLTSKLHFSAKQRKQGPAPAEAKPALAMEDLLEMYEQLALEQPPIYADDDMPYDMEEGDMSDSSMESSVGSNSEDSEDEEYWSKTSSDEWSDEEMED